jgi:hypothetical protein|tara:strand:- start:2911 stop:3873 length:963 start_codon:yes stop_codon:yes gene_type:complete
MINSVRQTVMSVLNKNNYGYISPSDFNLFAKQAQLDLFENYFYSYNYQILKENGRQSGTGYADITKGLEEVIDTFSETKFLVHNYQNRFFTPSLVTTNDDYYLLNKVLVYSKEEVSGTTNQVQIQSLIDTTKDFVALGVSIGDIVANTTSNLVGFVSQVQTIELTLVDVDGNPNNVGFLSNDQNYIVYSPSPIKEAEKVSNSKITMLNNSVITKPTLMFPAYSLQEPTISLFPNTIDKMGGVECQYIRFPKVPKWTYVDLVNGEPAFNQSAADYQDFELPNDDEVNLINKILQYAGMSIREAGAVQFATTLDSASNASEK